MKRQDLFSLSDDSNEMSRLVFSEKIKKKFECHRLQILLDALMVKH